MKKPQVVTSGFWGSGRRESNPRSQLGKLLGGVTDVPICTSRNRFALVTSTSRTGLYGPERLRMCHGCAMAVVERQTPQPHSGELRTDDASPDRSMSGSISCAYRGGW